MSLIYNNMRSVEEERKKITEYIKKLDITDKHQI